MNTAEFQSGAWQWKVVLFTDLVDSTLVRESVGEASAQDFWARHDSAGRALIRRWNGREVGRTDGF